MPAKKSYKLSPLHTALFFFLGILIAITIGFFASQSYLFREDSSQVSVQPSTTVSQVPTTVAPTTIATTIVTETSTPTPTPTQTPSPSPTVIPTAEPTQVPRGNPSVDLTDPELLASQQLAYEQTMELSQTGATSTPIDKKYVFLTFDDGPSDNMPPLLDILNQNQVKSTFFVKYSPSEDYYRRAVEEGHTLALHTYTHEYSKIYASETAFFDDLNQISDYVKSITGIESKIMRFAGGSSNTVSAKYSQGIMSRLTQAMGERGYAYFDWNADCMDASTKNPSPTDLLNNLKKSTYVGSTAKPYLIALLHNAAAQTTTVEAIQSIIDFYKGEGYTFVPLRVDSPAIHHHINN